MEASHAQPPGTAVAVRKWGSGAGISVGHAVGSGWEVHALEPAAPPAARLARDPRIHVHRERAEAIDVAPGTFDAVFAWMVVEHLEDPGTVLRKVAAALRPGGYFVFSVPNAGCWEFVAFRSRWYGLDVPRHLWHFTPQTLARLLGACGLRVERVFHQKVLRNITGSLDFLAADRPALPAPPRRLAPLLTPAWVSFGPRGAPPALRQRRAHSA